MKTNLIKTVLTLTILTCLSTAFAGDFLAAFENLGPDQIAALTPEQQQALLAAAQQGLAQVTQLEAQFNAELERLENDGQMPEQQPEARQADQ